MNMLENMKKYGNTKNATVSEKTPLFCRNLEKIPSKSVALLKFQFGYLFTLMTLPNDILLLSKV